MRRAELSAFTAAALAGAVLAYFFHGARGAARRALVRDRFHRGLLQLERAGHATACGLAGITRQRR